MIPDGWERVQLGQVSDVEKRRWEPGGEPCRYVGLEHIESGARKILEWADSSTIASTKTPFSGQDVLFGKLRPYLKKCAMPGFNGVCSTDVLVIKSKDRILPRILLEVCSSDEFIDFAVKHSGGTRMPRTSWKALQNYVLALPNRDEQQKLVEIFGTFESLVHYSKSALAQTRRLKQALLHQLLTKGIDENGKPHTRFKKTEVGEIPEEWEVVSLSEVGCVQTGIAKNSKLNATQSVELPYLRVANVQDGHIRLDEIKTIRVAKDKADRYKLRSGDVLLTEGGDADKLGRGDVWLGQIEPCLHQNHVFAVRCNKDLLRPDFLAVCTSSLYGKRYFLGCSKQTTNLASINSTQLKDFPTLLPPVDEQDRILERLMHVRELELAQTSALSRTEAIRKAVSCDLLSGRVRVKDLKL